MFTAVMSRITISCAMSRTVSSAPLLVVPAASVWAACGRWVTGFVVVGWCRWKRMTLSFLSQTSLSGLGNQTVMSDVKGAASAESGPPVAQPSDAFR